MLEAIYGLWVAVGLRLVLGTATLCNVRAALTIPGACTNLHLLCYYPHVLMWWVRRAVATCEQ